MFEVKNLCGGYGRSDVIHDVSLSFNEGTITTVIGRNGSGKSTVVRMMSGIIPYRCGEVSVGKDNISKLSHKEIAKRIAYLSQSKNIPDITVERMVLHGRFPYLEYPRKYRKSDIEIALEAMNRLGINEFAEKKLSELSGGMRQKVYIAMSLAQQTPIIVMDEPTTYLDIGEQSRFCNIVKDLACRGKTLVLILHDIITALRISDKIAVMDYGEIIAFGTPNDIITSGVIEKIYGVEICTFSSNEDIYYYYKEK